MVIRGRSIFLFLIIGLVHSVIGGSPKSTNSSPNANGRDTLLHRLHKRAVSLNTAKTLPNLIIPLKSSTFVKRLSSSGKSNAAFPGNFNFTVQTIRLNVSFSFDPAKYRWSDCMAQLDSSGTVTGSASLGAIYNRLNSMDRTTLAHFMKLEADRTVASLKATIRYLSTSRLKGNKLRARHAAPVPSQLASPRESAPLLFSTFRFITYALGIDYDSERDVLHVNVMCPFILSNVRHFLWRSVSVETYQLEQQLFGPPFREALQHVTFISEIIADIVLVLFDMRVTLSLVALFLYAVLQLWLEISEFSRSIASQAPPGSATATVASSTSPRDASPTAFPAAPAPLMRLEALTQAEGSQTALSLQNSIAHTWPKTAKDASWRRDPPSSGSGQGESVILAAQLQVPRNIRRTFNGDVPLHLIEWRGESCPQGAHPLRITSNRFSA